jgi:hypothetical protein
MDLLKVAAADASEKIGKSLLDALARLGDDNSIDNVTDAMDGLSTSIANAITGVSLLIQKLGNLPGGGTTPLFDVLFASGGKGISVLLGEAQKAKTAPSNAEGRSSSRVYLQQLRLENKIVKELNKQRAAELAALKAKSEVDKLKDKFDVERIGFTLALNQATDAETKLRLQAKIAILDNNEALAKKINAEMDGAEKAKLLADALVKAGNAALYFKDWADYRAGERGDAASMSNVPASGGTGGGYSPIPTPSFNMGAVQRGEYPVTVNVAGSILTDQDLTNTITDTILRINKMGRGTTPAGGLSGGT